MLAGKVPTIAANSALTRAVQQLGAGLKRVPLHAWQLLVVVLCLLVIANSGAKLLWALWPQQQPQQPLNATLSLQPASAGNAGAASADISGLLKLNLYGVAGEVIVNEPVDTIPANEEFEAEDTKLALKLTGVLSSSDPKAARAMIAHSNKQAVYKVGDKLPAGRNVTLDRVLERRVILNNAGRYESLWLFEEMEGEPLLVETPVAESRVQPVNKPVARQRPAAQVVKRELPTPETLAQVIRVTKRKQGFEVSPLKSLAQFEQLGFKAGDVVTAVNGTPVSTDPEQLRQLYLEVLQAPTAQMQILRSGQTVDIDIDLAKLSQVINQ
ncbi:type II secretion system protein GspC [bacterium SCSIO 12696]|nr:type II secretion system protein GspC [bacterium SCSIO 12696]